MPGELPENTWMSEEMVSGPAPAGIATSATVKSKLPPPWPTSKIDAALLGGKRRRQQLAVLHDVGELAGDVGRAGIAVGEHVAGAQDVEDLAHQLGRSRPRRCGT